MTVNSFVFCVGEGRKEETRKQKIEEEEEEEEEEAQTAINTERSIGSNLWHRLKIDHMSNIPAIIRTECSMVSCPLSLSNVTKKLK